MLTIVPPETWDRAHGKRALLTATLRVRPNRLSCDLRPKLPKLEGRLFQVALRRGYLPACVNGFLTGDDRIVLWAEAEPVERFA